MEIADVITPVQEHAFEVGKRITVAGLRDLPEVHLRLLEAPVTAVLGTVNPGGTAQLTPVWCDPADVEMWRAYRTGRADAARVNKQLGLFAPPARGC